MLRLLLALTLLQAGLSHAADRPNVLFIAVDDLKPALGCFDDAVAQTPHIDRLASRGTVFLNNHCQQAVCGPSRASLLTGLRPDHTGVWDLKTRMRDVNPGVVALPQHFKQHGYETVGVGKIYDPRCVDNRTDRDAPSWSLPYVHFATNPDEEFGLLNPEHVAAIRAKRAEAKAEGITGWNAMRNHIGGTPAVEGTEDVPDEAYDDGQIAKEGVRLIRELSGKEKPFFIAVGFKKPHLPFVAPKRYWDLYQRDAFELAAYQDMPVGAPGYHFQDSWELKNGSYSGIAKEGRQPDDIQRKLIHGYYACVSYIDAQVVKLLDALEETGVAGNTVIVLWGDHGFHLGDHGMWCKHTNYEQATRSPLLIAAPGQGAQGGRATAPTEFVDIFPTLCDLAGLPLPKGLDGVSLRPILHNAAASVKPAAISQFPRHVGHQEEAMGYAYRDSRYRYIEWVKKDYRAGEEEGELMARELYDYETDPLEKTNLIDDPAYADVVARFQEQKAGSRARASTDEVIVPPDVKVMPVEGTWREADETAVYKQTEEGPLELKVFYPEGWKPTDQRPAVVFFHGGGWAQGNPKAFYWQSIYLASRGMVAISAEYRLGNTHGTTPLECVLDGRSAMRFVRANATRLGIDPSRIAAGGGSAGGHVAASTALLSDINDPSDPNVDSTPAALVLFNPVLDTTPSGFGHRRVGENPERLSPIHRLEGSAPPTLIFNGTADKTTTLETAYAFRAAMLERGNRCEVVAYQDQGHSFFHRNRNEGRNFSDTVRRMGNFFESLGFLEAQPN